MASLRMIVGKWQLRNQLSKRNSLAKDVGEAFSLHDGMFRAGISTATETISAHGKFAGGIVAPYTVYKGKAALSAAPVLPTFSKLDSGGLKVHRRGTIMLTFWPASGERKYDWEKRQLLPQGLRTSFEGIGRSTWILLRHGSKAWPIQVVDAVMQNGWREFRTAHGIAPNYKLIFMCERKWIFNVIIFDENDIEVSYNWTMLANEHWRQFHTIQGNLITGCLPSTILSNLPLIKSGYCCIPKVNYLQEFQSRLEPVLEDLNLQTISIRMGNKSWTISVDNGYLNAAMFNPFLNALQLQVHDYVFIAMLPNLEVRVVILDAGNNKERIYDWL